MPQITISLDDDIKKILEQRAKKNLFSLKEQVEDILRKSAVRSKNAKKVQTIKIDDKLVSIFARNKQGRKIKK